jgi:hypothetical protein
MGIRDVFQALVKEGERGRFCQPLIGNKIKVKRIKVQV